MNVTKVGPRTRDEGLSEYEFTLKYLLSSVDANPVELLERLGDGG